MAMMEMRAAAQNRLAAPLDPDAVPTALAARVTETSETGFGPVSGGMLARRRRLGTLVLSDHTLPTDPAETASAFLGAVAGVELHPLPWTEARRQFQTRVALLRRLEPEAGWPDVSDAGLKATAGSWLAPHLLGMRRLADLDRLDLIGLLCAARCPGRSPVGWIASCRNTCRCL